MRKSSSVHPTTHVAVMSKLNWSILCFEECLITFKVIWTNGFGSWSFITKLCCHTIHSLRWLSTHHILWVCVDLPVRREEVCLRAIVCVFYVCVRVCGALQFPPGHCVKSCWQGDCELTHCAATMPGLRRAIKMVAMLLLLRCGRANRFSRRSRPRTAGQESAAVDTFVLADGCHGNSLGGRWMFSELARWCKTVDVFSTDCLWPSVRRPFAT